MHSVEYSESFQLELGIRIAHLNFMMLSGNTKLRLTEEYASSSLVIILSGLTTLHQIAYLMLCKKSQCISCLRRILNSHFRRRISVGSNAIPTIGNERSHLITHSLNCIRSDANSTSKTGLIYATDCLNLTWYHLTWLDMVYLHISTKHVLTAKIF